MGALSGLFGSKPKDYVIRPGEFAELYRQERMGASPNVNNAFGSSAVTWDGDQATVNQTLSPELQAIAQQMMGHVGQGPQQLGAYSNPFIEGLMGNVGQGIAARQGLQAPQMNMGGYQTTGGYQQNAPIQAPQTGLPQSGLPQMQPEQPMNGAMPVNAYQPQEYSGMPGGGGYGGMASGGNALGQLLGDWDMMQHRMNQSPSNYNVGR